MHRFDATPSSIRPRPYSWLFIGIAAWVCGLAIGLKMLVAYELRPGSEGIAPTSWPKAAGVLPDTKRPTLVLFVHPQCPCTRATVAELAQIITAAPEQVATLVFVYAPEGELDSWTNTSLVQSIRKLPGVRIEPDADGRMSALFGAITSGQALLFDSHGHLRFSGGITGARGHQGDNVGRRAVLARITGRETAPVKTLVYGCSLQGEPLAPETGS
jgi:hypothetical protein